MATGRRDYTWGFLSEVATEGRYCESFTPGFNGVIPPLETKQMYFYTVPPGKKLTVNSVWVSCTLRDVNVFSVYLKGQCMLSVYFSDHFCFNFSDKNPPLLVKGDTVSLQCTNLVDSANQFMGGLIGNLETI